MYSKIRIISYNCESLARNVVFARMLLEECDILLLQETLLVDHSSEILQDLHDSFYYYCTSAKRNSANFTGKSSGSLAVVYRRN